MHSTAARPHTNPLSVFSWYREGLRAALLARPRWDRVHASPATLALLAAGAVLLSVILERLYLGEVAGFNWRAIGNGWFGTALTAWACYLARSDNRYDPNPNVAPGPAYLICAVFALLQSVHLIGALLYFGMLQAGLFDNEGDFGEYAAWAAWLFPTAWALVAQIALVKRSGARRPGPRLLAAAVIVSSTILYFWLPPAHFWTSAGPGYAETPRQRLTLTQELMEAQPRLMQDRLAQIEAGRAGAVEMYAMTFAPYSDEDVFRNESAMVSEVLAQRFGTAGRQLQLVNHVETVQEWPWATPLNLRRAIAHFAARMNPEEDVLFLHLTSHGARDGKLAAEFWPMSVDSVTPQDLKAWLDEAGIRHRVLSISACYSGSWIAPLADDNTLIVTAADADHTSYGCGRGSELTFFGRAMYDEQLRSHTFSFEQAHATAREVIRAREVDAGKDDGYSNPQIAVGGAIRERLALLQERLQRENRVLQAAGSDGGN